MRASLFANATAVQECAIRYSAAEGAILRRDLSGNSIYQASGIRSPLPKQFAGTFLRAGPSRVLRVLPMGYKPSLSYTPVPSVPI